MLETRSLPDDVKMETVPCDLCGADNLSVWDRARANTLVQCRNCGLVFTNPRIAQAADKDKLLYDRGYFEQPSRMSDKLVRARHRSHWRELSCLRRLVFGGRILDVGCGTGAFLRHFDVRWERHGCDVSSYALEEARKHGITTHHGEFETLDFAGLNFDVVYFRASLHHTYSPRRCLARAVELAKPGGYVVVSMSPTHDGLCGRLFRGRVRSYEQAHNYLFSTVILRRYLEGAGLRVEEVRHPYFGTGYESWRDFVELPIRYAQFLWMKATGRLEHPCNHDFASPPFHGNYVSLYARKPSPRTDT